MEAREMGDDATAAVGVGDERARRRRRAAEQGEDDDDAPAAEFCGEPWWWCHFFGTGTGTRRAQLVDRRSRPALLIYYDFRPCIILVRVSLSVSPILFLSLACVFVCLYIYACISCLLNSSASFHPLFPSSSLRFFLPSDERKRRRRLLISIWQLRNTT